MDKKKSFILVTGAAGFIGAALSKKLLSEGKNVIGIDNLNNYYDPKLKNARIENISKSLGKNHGIWIFKEISLNSYESLIEIANNFSIKIIINLAAQAGVRYSIENPNSYIQSNLVGFGNVLELCRYLKIKNFIFASSSSVYGGNKSIHSKRVILLIIQ